MFAKDAFNQTIKQKFPNSKPKKLNNLLTVLEIDKFLFQQILEHEDTDNMKHLLKFVEVHGHEKTKNFMNGLSHFTPNGEIIDIIVTVCGICEVMVDYDKLKNDFEFNEYFMCKMSYALRQKITTNHTENRCDILRKHGFNKIKKLYLDKPLPNGFLHTLYLHYDMIEFVYLAFCGLAKRRLLKRYPNKPWNVIKNKNKTMDELASSFLITLLLTIHEKEYVVGGHLLFSNDYLIRIISKFL